MLSELENNTYVIVCVTDPQGGLLPWQQTYTATIQAIVRCADDEIQALVTEYNAGASAENRYLAMKIPERI